MEDKRYIYYLTQEGDSLESCSKLLIFPEAECMKQLAHMVDNASDTVIDMQDYIRRKNLDEVLYPAYDYCVVLSGVTKDSESASEEYIPIDEDEYEDKIHELEKEIGMTDDSASKQAKQRKLENIKWRYKKDFLRIMEIKSQAYTFLNTYEELEKQVSPQVIAISTRKIGWETERTINFEGNLDCNFKTNFGYGSARYLYLIMYYKSVPIFLYSEWVKYFIANKTDIIRHTQSYSTEDSSWGRCFDLVRDIHNSLKDGDDSFVERWMEKEVRHLVEGLEAIANNEKNTFLVKNTNQTYRISGRRDFTVFKAEKLSGALVFIESIENLDQFGLKTQVYTDKIIEMNKAAYPEFVIEKDRIKRICERKDVELREAISQKEKKEEDIKIRFNSRINRIKNEYFLKYNEKMEDFEAEEELKSKSPNYKRALKEIEIIGLTIAHLETFKKKLEDQYSVLANSIGAIIEYIPSLEKS